MTDVLSPMLIPYARFLEVRARRYRRTETIPEDIEVLAGGDAIEDRGISLESARHHDPAPTPKIAIDEEQTAVMQVVDMKPVSS
jgi:hypothetical protein